MENKKIIAQGFDIIGDIHGYVNALKRLLSTLGYSEQNGIWSHPQRKAIFVGDLVVQLVIMTNEQDYAKSITTHTSLMR